MPAVQEYLPNYAVLIFKLVNKTDDCCKQTAGEPKYARQLEEKQTGTTF